LTTEQGDFLGNTAQFPPYGLSTAPAAAARHLRCQNYTKYYLRFWLSSCRTSLAVSALRIMRYCHKLKKNTAFEPRRRCAAQKLVRYRKMQAATFYHQVP